MMEKIVENPEEMLIFLFGQFVSGKIEKREETVATLFYAQQTRRSTLFWSGTKRMENRFETVKETRALKIFCSVCFAPVGICVLKLSLKPPKQGTK